MSVDFYRDDFIKYKKIAPKYTIELVGGRKKKRYHLVNSNELEPADVKNYSLGYELHNNKNNGFFLPTFPKYKPELIGEHGQRLILSLIGISGSGKSHLCSKLAKQWIKANSACPSLDEEHEGGGIIVITPKPDNKELNKLNPRYINIIDYEKQNYNFIDDETRVRFYDEKGGTDFKNALLIIDDLESVAGKDKKHTEVIMNNIINDIIVPCLNSGRHENCSLIYIRHSSDITTKFYRQVLSESDYVGLFFSHGDIHRNRYIMKNHLLYNDKFVKQIIKMCPRYCLFHKRNPPYCIMESDVIKAEV